MYREFGIINTHNLNNGWECVVINCIDYNCTGKINLEVIFNEDNKAIAIKQDCHCAKCGATLKAENNLKPQ